jgi:hypothetical protein
MKRRLLVLRMALFDVPAFALFLLYIAVACLVARAAYADTGGIDVTSTLRDLADVIVPGACIFVAYYVRKWMADHTGGQSEALDWNAFNSGLEAVAHSAVNDHLLAGKTVTIDTKNELGNHLVGIANSQLAMEIKRLGLNDQAVATRAAAAVAKVLNMMPAAPPFLAPPAAVPASN